MSVPDRKPVDLAISQDVENITRKKCLWKLASIMQRAGGLTVQAFSREDTIDTKDSEARYSARGTTLRQAQTWGGFWSPEACFRPDEGLAEMRLALLLATAACVFSLAEVAPFRPARAGASLGGAGGGLSGIQNPVTVEYPIPVP